MFCTPHVCAKIYAAICHGSWAECFLMHNFCTQRETILKNMSGKFLHPPYFPCLLSFLRCFSAETKEHRQCQKAMIVPLLLYLFCRFFLQFSGFPAFLSGISPTWMTMFNISTTPHLRTPGKQFSSVVPKSSSQGLLPVFATVFYGVLFPVIWELL